MKNYRENRSLENKVLKNEKQTKKNSPYLTFFFFFNWTLFELELFSTLDPKASGSISPNATES